MSQGVQSKPAARSLLRRAAVGGLILPPDILGKGLDEGRLLGRIRFGLVLRHPIRVGHPVDHLAGLILGQLDPALGCGFLIPAAETVAAEAAEVRLSRKFWGKRPLKN